jgi:D-ornithine 4,5-aminomutase subunit alpha
MKPRADDFEKRREHLKGLSEEELKTYFWKLVQEIVDPLIEEAKGHTSPSIERSVLMRMGFSSLEAKPLVYKIMEQGLLGHGAGKLVLRLAEQKSISVREAGLGLLEGNYWEDLAK